jgi:hypothetical protein
MTITVNLRQEMPNTDTAPIFQRIIAENTSAPIVLKSAL